LWLNTARKRFRLLRGDKNETSWFISSPALVYWC
jgi:hypothetical protein